MHAVLATFDPAMIGAGSLLLVLILNSVGMTRNSAWPEKEDNYEQLTQPMRYTHVPKNKKLCVGLKVQ